MLVGGVQLRAIKWQYFGRDASSVIYDLSHKYCEIERHRLSVAIAGWLQAGIF